MARLFCKISVSLRLRYIIIICCSKEKHITREREEEDDEVDDVILNGDERRNLKKLMSTAYLEGNIAPYRIF